MRPVPRSWRRLAQTGVLLAAALSAVVHAADPPAGKAASREREMLRRSQAALQEASAARDAAVAQRAAAEKERDAARESAKTELALLKGRQAQTLAAERQRAQLALEAFRAENEQLRQQGAAAAVSATERETMLTEQLLAARREAAERTQANRQLAEMLAQATRSLAEAEKRNQALHQAALDLVERWRNKGTAEVAMAGDPVLGLRAVSEESAAEELRSRIDALRNPAQP